MRLELNNLAPVAIATSWLVIPAIWLDLASIWALLAAYVLTAYFHNALPPGSDRTSGVGLLVLIAKCFAITAVPQIVLATGLLPANVPALGTGFDQWIGSQLSTDRTLMTGSAGILIAATILATITTVLLVIRTSRKIQSLIRNSYETTERTPNVGAVQANASAATFGLIFIPVFLFLFASPAAGLQTGPHLALITALIAITPYLLLCLWAVAAGNIRSEVEIITHKNNKEG